MTSKHVKTSGRRKARAVRRASAIITYYTAFSIDQIVSIYSLVFSLRKSYKKRD